jgi:hypothetical protein
MGVIGQVNIFCIKITRPIRQSCPFFVVGLNVLFFSTSVFLTHEETSVMCLLLSTQYKLLLMECSNIAQLDEAYRGVPGNSSEVLKELMSSHPEFILHFDSESKLTIVYDTQRSSFKPGLNLLYLVKCYSLNCVSKTRHSR